MIGVKVQPLPPLPPGLEPHVVALIGRLLETARRTLLAQDLDGLRPSHVRLLSHVPPGGTTTSDLASVLHMTKQGTGQFVTQLHGTGHLDVTTDHADRRRRLVTRTPRGDRLTARANETIGAVEQHWQELVGRERYGAFRQVLREIADEETPRPRH